jgi:hypothetical protein
MSYKFQTKEQKEEFDVKLDRFLKEEEGGPVKKFSLGMLRFVFGLIGMAMGTFVLGLSSRLGWEVFIIGWSWFD